MKICVLGLPAIPRGTHNLKDPRLDEADRLVEAKKKAYAQVEVVEAEDLAHADAIVTDHDGFLELIFKDHEFIETRLTRDPSEAERAALLKLKAQLEADQTVHAARLTPEERQALTIHGFATSRPVTVATAEETAQPEGLMLRAFKEAGWICFLTVGGKENRAWAIRAGTSAWDAAGVIHTDIQKGFIRAEIISYADFIAAGGETEAKRAGKQRLELKTYVMQDYDLANFRFNK
jgi:ribosome-binding ATPase YchF (GTP1/OBG family)